MSAFSFDANSVQPTESLDPVPAGWYRCQIVETSLNPTRDGNGEYLTVVSQIKEGGYAGRKLFARHNTRNRNPMATEIGMKEVSAHCRSVGMMQIQDTQQFVGAPVDVKVVIRPAADGYDAQNEFKGYAPYGTGGGVAAPVATPAPVAPAPAPAPAPEAAPTPWGTPAAAAPAAPAAWTPPAPPAAAAPPPWVK